MKNRLTLWTAAGVVLAAGAAFRQGMPGPQRTEIMMMEKRQAQHPPKP